jgi:hypothetical protein
LNVERGDSGEPPAPPPEANAVAEEDEGEGAANGALARPLEGEWMGVVAVALVLLRDAQKSS